MSLKTIEKRAGVWYNVVVDLLIKLIFVLPLKTSVTLLNVIISKEWQMNYIQEDFLNLSDSAMLKELGISVVSYKHIDSTNLTARRLAAQGCATPLLIVADSQSEGRGRMGRSFYSPNATGLYMTLLLDVTDDAPPSIVKITSAAAVAVSSAIEHVTDADCRIKWVNDLYLNGKKISGILAEAFFENDRKYVCVGVGVNICTEDFPEELKGIAGAIGADVNLRGKLATEICREMLDIYMKIKNGNLAYMDEYRRRSLVLGREVRFFENGKSFEGVAVSVDDDGGLCVLLDNNQRVILRSGEISLRLK